ncbi:MAG: packaged DNA stabilization gp4 family protein [Rhodospirillales bacterium]
MATVTDIVNGALLLLEVRTAESAVTAPEAEDGLTSLNDMMNEWNVDGINVGYETLENISDELYVDLGAIGAIKANLAVYIAPEYGRIVSDTLAVRARRSKKSLRASIKLNPSDYPDTLPIGSGNEANNFTADGDSPGLLRGSKFYPSNVRRKCN